MIAFLDLAHWRRNLCLASLFGLLWGCSDLKMDSDELTSRTTAPQAGANCASCHAHPPGDINHTYHLFMTDSNITSNRPITCLHCHSKSIAGYPVTYLDSIFVDSSGNEFHSLNYPRDSGIRLMRLDRVEKLVKIRPRPLPARPGYKGPQEWMTALAHMNGKVDIDFDSTSIDTAKFHGVKANYSVQNLTCSAVACHPNHNAYRWPIPSKGLPILRGE